MLTTIVAMCVVDMHRLYKQQDKDRFEKLFIVKFADLVVGDLPIKPSRRGAHGGLGIAETQTNRSTNNKHASVG